MEVLEWNDPTVIHSGGGGHPSTPGRWEGEEVVPSPVLTSEPCCCCCFSGGAEGSRNKDGEEHAERDGPVLHKDTTRGTEVIME